MAAYKPRGPSTPLREIRRLHGMSRAQLAKEAGVSLDTLSHIEHGRDLHVSTARKLVRVLGVTLDMAFPDRQGDAHERNQ
jgi:transcriptional regulator with XRE-family HTH domain